jgi:hypothetical protein
MILAIGYLLHLNRLERMKTSFPGRMMLLKELTTKLHIFSRILRTALGVLSCSKVSLRPAHADPAPDLWWRGLNPAQDPGTYLYNATSPWENYLTSAFVHNTVIVDEQEFMRRAGRFLYLDWDQAETIPTPPLMGDNYPFICAKHNGYEKVGVTHSRIVASHNDGHWEIVDNLAGSPNRKHTIRLHWLLPDWEYDVHDTSDRSVILHMKYSFDLHME